MKPEQTRVVIVACASVEALAWGIAWWTDWAPIAVGFAIAVGIAIAGVLVMLQQRKPK